MTTWAGVLFGALCAGGQAFAQPDMGRQENWTDSDKKAFLQYLQRGGAPAPEAGSVQTVPGAEKEAVRARKARYLTLDLASDTLFTVGAHGAIHPESMSLAPKLIAGGHLFSWIRYYGGAQYDRIGLSQKAGGRAGVDHFRFPMGLELALIPLGTPQTRYVVLRAGVSAHNFRTPLVADAFNTPLIGWQGSWDLGLGYEWQIPDTRWRLHLLAEGYKSFTLQDSSHFYGMGATAGAAYTF